MGKLNRFLKPRIWIISIKYLASKFKIYNWVLCKLYRKHHPQPEGNEDPQPEGNEDPQPAGNEDPQPEGNEDLQPEGNEDPQPEGNEGQLVDPQHQENEDPQHQGQQVDLPLHQGQQVDPPHELAQLQQQLMRSESQDLEGAEVNEDLQNQDPQNQGLEDPQNQGHEDPQNQGNEDLLDASIGDQVTETQANRHNQIIHAVDESNTSSIMEMVVEYQRTKTSKEIEDALRKLKEWSSCNFDHHKHLDDLAAVCQALELLYKKGRICKIHRNALLNHLKDIVSIERFYQEIQSKLSNAKIFKENHSAMITIMESKMAKSLSTLEELKNVRATIINLDGQLELAKKRETVLSTSPCEEAHDVQVTKNEVDGQLELAKEERNCFLRFLTETFGQNSFSLLGKLKLTIRLMMVAQTFFNSSSVERHLVIFDSMIVIIAE